MYGTVFDTAIIRLGSTQGRLGVYLQQRMGAISSNVLRAGLALHKAGGSL